MQTLFSPDSKLMQSLSRLFDLAVLNCVFLLTCIPVITIGAASAAMYTVCFRMGTEAEAGVVKPYFRAFRDNFRQGTILWLISLAFFAVGLFDFFLFYQREGMTRYLYLPVAILLVLGVLAFGYLFPLVSRFENRVWGTVKNALLMSVAYLPRSIAIAVLNLLPLGLLLFNTYLFVRLGFLWLFCYYGCAAYLNTRLLEKVFAPFLNQTE